MAEVPGLTGLSSPLVESATVRPAGTLAGDALGQQTTGRGRAPDPAGGVTGGAPNVIRFEGRDLDPMAPRGTYLDITV